MLVRYTFGPRHLLVDREVGDVSLGDLLLEGEVGDATLGTLLVEGEVGDASGG